MKKILLALLLGFIFGFYAQSHISIIEQKAHAEVAGMSKYDLKYDYDFKNAVKDIVSDSCSVGYNGSINCF